MNLLITSGATVTFKQLLKFVLTDNFLQLCIEIGFTSISIQYGNEHKCTQNLSLEYVNECLQTTSLEPLKAARQTLTTNFTTLVHQKGTVAEIDDNVHIEMFPFDMNFSSYIEKADLIISHGGTGTILDVLKHHKPLIVIPNDTLMDNHQQEICNEFCQLGYIVSIPSSKLAINDEFLGLCKDLVEGRIVLNRFESQGSKVVEGIIYEEMEKV